MRNKCIVIAGTAGVGKTELAKRYKNVIDLESSIYSWDYSGYGDNPDIEKLKGVEGRPLNKDWPQNYIDAIKAAMREYDYVLVGGNINKNFANYRDAGIDFEIFTLEKAAIPIYVERFVARGNSREWAEKVYALYDEYLPRYVNFGVKITILKRDETLESFLLQNPGEYPKLVTR
jgi:hypothetical protein